MKLTCCVFVFSILPFGVVNLASANEFLSDASTCETADAPDGGIAKCDEDRNLPTCIDSLTESFDYDNIDPPVQGSNGYSLPAPLAKMFVTDSIDSLVDENDLYTARSIVSLPNDANLDYIICRDPEDRDVARWEPRTEGTGAMRFALRLGRAPQPPGRAPEPWIRFPGVRI